MKGLEALEKIKNWECFVDFEIDTNGEKEFGEELSIIEKELKALEIIKKDTHILNDEGVERIIIPFYDNIFTDKEEYELLKEVLISDKTKIN